MRKSFSIAVAITLWIFLGLLAGCEDEQYKAVNNSAHQKEIYPIETEVSLSPDGSCLYYISTDTVNPEQCGIFKASVAAPVRQMVLAGQGYHSPVISLDNTTLAFIDSGRIHYYDMDSQIVTPSAIPDSFSSIVYINDTMLVGNREQWLYLIDEKNQTAAFYGYGWDPSFSARDTIVYFKGSDSSYSIVRNDITRSWEIVLYRLTTRARPHWPTYEKVMRRLAFSVAGDSGQYVYTSGVGYPTYPIDSTYGTYSRPYLIDYNLLVYTGHTGQLFRSNFYGTNISPFIFVKER